MSESITSTALYFVGHINYDSASDLVNRINQTQSNGGQKGISVMMSTGGGHTNAAIFLYDYIRSLSFPVTMIASGAVDSAGIYPFLAGDFRIAMPTASFLFHPSIHSVSEGCREGFIEAMNQWDAEAEICSTIVASRTAITTEARAALVSERVRVTASRALELGIIHALGGYNDKPLPEE